MVVVSSVNNCFIFSLTCSFFFNDTATTEIYTLSLHDALPISRRGRRWCRPDGSARSSTNRAPRDRKSTRLNSSHANISYAVFCLKKKTTIEVHLTALNEHLSSEPTLHVLSGLCGDVELDNRVQQQDKHGTYQLSLLFFFFNDTATTEIYTLSLHDALPIAPPNTYTNSSIIAIGVMTVVMMVSRSEEHTSELQSRQYLVCRLLLEKKKKNKNILLLQQKKKKKKKKY